MKWPNLPHWTIPPDDTVWEARQKLDDNLAVIAAALRDPKYDREEIATTVDQLRAIVKRP